MNIKAPKGRHCHQGPRQNLSVSHHHDQVRIQRRNSRDVLLTPHVLGLQNRDGSLESLTLNPRRLRLRTTSNRPVRLSHQSNQIHTFRKPLEGRKGNLACAHEDDAHNPVQVTIIVGVCPDTQPAQAITNLLKPLSRPSPCKRPALRVPR